MQDINNTLAFNVKLTNFEKLNDNFTKAKCYVLTTGKNVNKTYISEEAVNASYYTLSYIPVVGHIKQDNQGNFILGGHDRMLDKKTFEFKNLCIPLGVAIPSPEPTWELCEEKDGTQKKYLTTNVILWTDRFPELEDVKFSEDIFCNQSMEITPNDFKPYSEDNSCMEILSFTFNALCMLNKSDDRRLNIDPCFPNASIVKADFSLGNTYFKEMLDEMKQELKLYFATINKGDDNLNNPDNKKNDDISFSATFNEKREAIRHELEKFNVREKDEDGRLIREVCHYIDDFDDNYVFFDEYIYEGGSDTSFHWKAEYTYIDDTAEVSIAMENSKRVSMVWLTDEEKEMLDSDIKNAQEENEALSQELAEYKETHSVSNDEVEELKAYKADNEAKIKKAETDSILKEFEETIGNTEDFASIKENADNLSIDELKEKLYVAVGKFTVANAKAQEKEQNSKISFSKMPVDDSACKNNDSVAYGGIVEKYCMK